MLTMMMLQQYLNICSPVFISVEYLWVFVFKEEFQIRSLFANCLQPRKVYAICPCLSSFVVVFGWIVLLLLLLLLCVWGLLATTRAPHTQPHTLPVTTSKVIFVYKAQPEKKHKSHAHTHIHRKCSVPLVAGLLVSLAPRCGCCTLREQPRVASFRRLLTWSTHASRGLVAPQMLCVWESELCHLAPSVEQC